MNQFNDEICMYVKIQLLKIIQYIIRSLYCWLYIVTINIYIYLYILPKDK